jgi:hypothetical protein
VVGSVATSCSDKKTSSIQVAGGCGVRGRTTSCRVLRCSVVLQSSRPRFACSEAHTSLPRCTHRHEAIFVLNQRSGRTSHVFDSPPCRHAAAWRPGNRGLDSTEDRKCSSSSPPAGARAHDDAEDDDGRRQWYGSHGRIALARVPLGGWLSYCLVRGFALPQGPGRLSRCSRWPLRPLPLPSRPFQPLSFVGASLVAGSGKVEGPAGRMAERSGETW